MARPGRGLDPDPGGQNSRRAPKRNPLANLHVIFKPGPLFANGHVLFLLMGIQKGGHTSLPLRSIYRPI